MFIECLMVIFPSPTGAVPAIAVWFRRSLENSLV
jgi:hypothetical protein